MNETMLKLRIWVHAETTLLKINARRTGQQVTLLAVALGLFVVTVGMINVGLFELLAETYGRVRGAFYLAGGNAVLAAIVLLRALLKKPGLEEEMVADIRDLVLTELQTDADEIKADYQRVANHVRQIEQKVSALTGPSSSLAQISALAPLVEVAIQTLKSRHEE
ncbi:MAG: hypothetical protein WBM48_13925 [Polyangiales bacterium]